MARPFRVTLVTGDRVVVEETGPGRYRTRVEPGPGRAGMAVRVLQGGGRLLVVPADAEALIASGRVDRRLFDVLELRRLGYGDSRRRDLPVLVTGARPAPGAAPRGTLPGRLGADPRAAVPRLRPAARVALAMPQVGAASWRADKRSAGRFWTATQRAALDPARAGERLWLVGQRRLLLEESTRQVGAPVAWAAGATGRGVTVAVLDSGYDPTHPDLAGAVRTARDFTDSAAGVRDEVGHGTHVASIVAGRGTASGGRYAGVARGATLAVGKVCATRGCAEDAILAGMVWAATTAKARVVTMSLGGAVPDGPDLLAQAVDTLTARTGTLFVAAAGNSGPRPGTVESPSTAASALSVGSVGRTDVVSGFSSRGPWAPVTATSGFGLKPDLVAPGEQIVAARARGTSDLAPVAGFGGRYGAASGTSMATPHVAGAAAVLAQRHPTWRAADLKAALTSAAAPATDAIGPGPDGAPAFAQGAGRLDLARALRARVVATSGPVDLGRAAWPNAGAAPVTRTITYANTGPAAVPLDLTAMLRGPDGRPLPDVLTLGARAVTVPPATAAGPGGASVTVTYRPGAGPVGARSGHVVAVGKGVRVRTAVGGYREPESYDLTVRALDSAGRPAARASAYLIDPAVGDFPVPVTADGRTVQRVAAERRVLHAFVVEEGPRGSRYTMAVHDLALTRDTEIVVDARRGRPVRVELDRPDATARPDGMFSVSQQTADLPISSYVWTSAKERFHVIPSGPVPGLTGIMWADFVKAGSGDPARGRPATPWVYHAAARVDGELPGDPTLRVAARDFAALRNAYARQNTREQLSTTVTGSPDVGASPGFAPLPLGSLRERTEFVTTGLDWSSTLVSRGGGVDGELRGPLLTRPAAGRTYPASWNRAVHGPGFGDDPGFQVARHPDGTVRGPLYLFSDAGGHVGPARDQDRGRLRLLSGDRVVAAGTDTSVVEGTVGTRATTLRLEATVERVPTRGAGTLGTSRSYVWTVRSGPVGGTPQVLPLQVVRFLPPVDALNRAPRGRTVTVPVRVDRPPGAAGAAVRTLTVQVSLDRGRTWRAAAVRPTGPGTWQVAVRHPARPGTVSLRASAVDRRGNGVRQTTVDSYAVR